MPSTQPEEEETDYCTGQSTSCVNTLDRIRSHPLTEMSDSDNRTDVSKAPYSSRSCAGKPLKFCVVQESGLFFTWGGATHVRGQKLTITLKWNDGNELYASLPDFIVHRLHPKRIIHSKIFTTFKIINIEEGAVRSTQSFNYIIGDKIIACSPSAPVEKLITYPNPLVFPVA